MKFTYVAKLSGSENHKGYRIYDDSNDWVCDVSPRDADGIKGKQLAALIVDAANTHTTTGLTPSELAERVKVLEEACQAAEALYRQERSMREQASAREVSTPINDGGPAFPTCLVHWNQAMIDRGPGMSLRDWFAGQAMQGLLANCWKDTGPEYTVEMAAHEAYRFADALLAAREAK